MFDGLPATVHHLGPGSEAFRHPVHRRLVLVADDPSVGGFGASVAKIAGLAGRPIGVADKPRPLSRLADEPAAHDLDFSHALVPVSESRWRGECFVFDERVAVNHDLNKGSYYQCHGCRMPITEQDKASEYYQPGVSCPKCYGKRSKQDKARFAEREKQVQLAEGRGEKHIGPQAVGDLIA